MKILEGKSIGVPQFP